MSPYVLQLLFSEKSQKRQQFNKSKVGENKSKTFESSEFLKLFDCLTQ
jgi:hypothetical protein